MLADFLYGLLIVVTVIAVFGVIRMARKLRHSSGASSESLLVLTLVLFGLLAVFFFLMKAQIQSVRESGGEVLKTDQQLFVEKVYPPLAEAQFQLDYQLKQLSILQERIYDLSRDHPQQSARLQLAYNTWRSERQGLMQLKQKADRAVRGAMGVHKVSDPSFVESEFNREAVDWETIISDRLNQYHDSQLQVTNAMIDNVMIQTKNIVASWQQKDALAIRTGGSLKSEFAPKTLSALVSYLEKTDWDVADTLTEIGKEVSIATQKRREVRNYSLEHTDLQAVLSRVIDGWLQLENKGVYFRDQLLHAIQAEYLAVLLGTNKNDNQLVRLRKTVSERAALLLEELKTKRSQLEKSYKTAPR